MPPKAIKLKRDKFGIDITGRIYGPLIKHDGLSGSKQDDYYSAPGHPFRWDADGRMFRSRIWIGSTRDETRDIVRFLNKREVK